MSRMLKTRHFNAKPSCSCFLRATHAATHNIYKKTVVYVIAPYDITIRTSVVWQDVTVFRGAGLWNTSQPHTHSIYKLL
jgi:hypothetical protein